MLKNEFKELIGFTGNIIELSNELQQLGCEDICYFGNWDELLEDKNIVVSTNNDGTENIQIYFSILEESKNDKIIEATKIKITNIEEFI